MQHGKFQFGIVQPLVPGRKGIRCGLKWAVLGGAIAFQPLPAFAQAALLNHWRFDPSANQLEVTLKDGVTPRYFLLAQPARIVLELPETEVGNTNTQQTYSGSSVRQVRVAQFKPGVTRMVLELSPNTVLAPGQVQLQRVEDGNAGVGDRWVLRPLLANTANSSAPTIAQSPPTQPAPPIAPSPSPQSTVVQKGGTLPNPASEAPALIPSSKPVVSAPPTIIKIVQPTVPISQVPSAPVVPAPNPVPPTTNGLPAPPDGSVVTGAGVPAPLPTVPDYSTPLPPDRPLSSANAPDRPSAIAVPTAPAPLVVSKPTVSISPPIAAPQPSTLPPTSPSPQPVVTATVPQPSVPGVPPAIPPTVSPAVPQTIAVEVPPAVTVPEIQPMAAVPVPAPITAPPPVVADVPTLPESAPPLPPATLSTPTAPMVTVPPLTPMPNPNMPAVRPTVSVPPLQSNPTAIERPDVPAVTPARPTAIKFGQPLPGGAAPVLTARSSTILLPTGSVLNLRYPGEAPLSLQPDRSQQEVMALQTEIRDYWGRLVAPVGTAVIGRFETGTNGSRFVAQAIALGTQNLPLAAQSDVLSGSLRQVSQSRLLLYSGIGGLAGGILGGFSGLDMVGGAAAGAAVGYLTTPKPATIQPGQVVQVKLTEDLK